MHRSNDNLVENVLVIEEVSSNSFPSALHHSYQNLLESLLSKKTIDDPQGILETPFCKENQLFSLYKSLCSFLLNGKRKQLEILQEDNGVIFLEASCYFPCENVCHQSFNAEMGVLLALYGHYTKDQLFLQQAYKAALWQKQLLDMNGIPLFGLFSKEATAIQSITLSWSYLLFLVVGTFLNKDELLSIYFLQKTYFLDKSFDPKISLIPTIERLFAPTESKQSSIQLESKIYDQVAALIGYRDKDLTAISSLYGSKMGLGTFLKNTKLGFITFGPQHLPYEECDHFGIEANASHYGALTSLLMQYKSTKNYSIQGHARVPCKKSLSDVRHSLSYQWIDILQEFNEDQLDLEITLLSIEDASELSFVFYVAAELCKVGEEHLIKTKSFSKYAGKPDLLEFSYEKNKVTLKPSSNCERMEIIPLAGSDCFWTGDFLVAFKMQPFTTLSWSLRTSTG